MEEGRDDWWNRDFVELMGRRLRLHECRTVLDCGCGRGHWSRALSHTLPADAEVVGVDREATWIADAEEIARRAALPGCFRYQQASVEELPFDDGRFDLVTCQTLLIHVPAPQRVLKEMLRVLKPQGLVLAAEPNNLGQCLRWNSLTVRECLEKDGGVDNLLRLVRFHVLCERGKHALGEGLGSVGDLLPGYFAELGLDEIQVFQSDKGAALFPPYVSPGQRAEVSDMRKAIDEGRYIWREDEARRYFLAGGGDESEFSQFWQWAMGENARVREALAGGQFYTAGGFTLYLVSGRKAGPRS